MVTLENMLPFRTTAKSSDEAICLGSMLGLDTGSIAEAPKESRMKLVWSRLPEIPSGVIFWPQPKLKQEGFRWAPSTLLNATYQLIDHKWEAGKATLCPEGLQVRYPGRKLGCVLGNAIRSLFRMMNPLGTIYCVSCLENDSIGKAQFETFDPWLLESKHTSRATLWMISPHDLDDRVGDDIEALLLLVYAKKDGVKFARSVFPVSQLGFFDEAWRRS